MVNLLVNCSLPANSKATRAPLCYALIGGWSYRVSKFCCYGLDVVNPPYLQRSRRFHRNSWETSTLRQRQHVKPHYHLVRIEQDCRGVVGCCIFSYKGSGDEGCMKGLFEAYAHFENMFALTSDVSVPLRI